MKTRKGLPYDLYEDLTVYVGLLGYAFELEGVMKLKDGYFTMFKGYSTDGSTGVPDYKSTWVAHFVHDGLCQAMRLGLLPPHRRKYCEEIYVRLCWRGGLPKWLAKIRGIGLSWFGKGAVLAKNERKIYEVLHPDEVKDYNVCESTS